MNQNDQNQTRFAIQPPSEAPNATWRELTRLAFIALGYWLSVRLGLLLVAHPEGIASIWPASGFALAILLLNPKSQWIKLLALIFVVNAAGNWSGGNSLPVSLGFALANTLEPFLCAWALIHVCKSKITFGRAIEIFSLFGVAIFVNGITALLGAAVPALAFGAPFLKTWWLWETADGLGIILITPLIVTWVAGRNARRPISLRNAAESILLVAIPAVFAWLLFGPFTVAENPVLRNYMIFPVLIWLAFRFSPHGMTGSLLIFAAIAVWNTLQGYGIFGFADQTVAERLASVQVFLVMTTFSGLLLSAIVAERRRAESILQARLRLSQLADSYSLDELLQKTLDEAEALTGSQIGFVHFLKADQKTLQLQMWSTNTLKNICTAEGKGAHYPVDEAGVWADSVFARAPLIHNDYANLARRKGLPPGHAPVLRELVTPILRNDLIVMILGVGNKPTDYDDNDVEVISQMANMAWDIVQRKRAEDALRVSEALLNTTQQLSKVGGWEWDVENQNMSWTDETYRIHDFSPDEIERGSAKYIERSVVCYDEKDRPKILNAFQRCVEQGESYDLEFPFTSAAGRRMWIRTTARAVWNKTRIVKVIGNIMDVTERKQAEDELRRAQQALTTINIELQTALAREKQLAHTDVLTGVNNRRSLFEHAEHEFEIAVRYRQPLSVIMFDIDHFKEVNDTFGHAIGDQILQNVTQVAGSELRSADVIGRYGGEEFVILLPMTNAQQAYPLAERIRSGVAEIHVPAEKGTASVTLSIGIVELIHSAPIGSPDDLIRRADEAMYAAKQAGRNRTEIGSYTGHGH